MISDSLPNLNSSDPAAQNSAINIISTAASEINTLIGGAGPKDPVYQLMNAVNSKSPAAIATASQQLLRAVNYQPPT